MNTRVTNFPVESRNAGSVSVPAGSVDDLLVVFATNLATCAMRGISGGGITWTALRENFVAPSFAENLSLFWGVRKTGQAGSFTLTATYGGVAQYNALVVDSWATAARPRHQERAMGAAHRSSSQASARP